MSGRPYGNSDSFAEITPIYFALHTSLGAFLMYAQILS